MGWYAVVTVRMKPDSRFVETTGRKILVICWVQIIQDGDGRIIGGTWEGPEIQVPLDFLRGHGRMVLRSARVAELPLRVRADVRVLQVQAT